MRTYAAQIKQKNVELLTCLQVVGKLPVGRFAAKLDYRHVIFFSQRIQLSLFHLLLRIVSLLYDYIVDCDGVTELST